MIDIIKADSPGLKKRLETIRNRLFEWSALEKSSRYRKTSKRIFKKVLSPDEAVRKIISDIREKGDAALLKYTKGLDSVTLTKKQIQVPAREILNAYKEVPKKFRKALATGIRNVKQFQKKLLSCQTGFKDARFTRHINPVESTGIYIPGGTGGDTPLSSSVYMNVIPAVVAGVKNIIVCTPPGQKGKISPFLLTALSACGVEKVYRAGGAQAVAAMAYGTETVPRVDMIAGPGNLFVTLAKREVLGQVGIDLLAGPSEILVIADRNADPLFIAADLLGQAEHDPLASSILLTMSIDLADKVKKELKKQTKELKRRKIIEASLKQFGAIIIAKSQKQIIDITNTIAPEHLEIMTENAASISKEIRNAGTIFLGSYTPEAIGDYIAGPSHTLPTSGTARFFSGLSVDSFMKKTSVVRFPKSEFNKFADDVEILAESEGLGAHSNSIRVRRA